MSGGGHARVGADPGQCLERGAVTHHIEFPGLLVDGRGGLHGRPEDGHGFLLLHGLVLVAADADARKNRIHKQTPSLR